ncbi:hypothetical protein [Fictibacillus fluitans]|uniref:LSM domain-containing protein n=1 Tax=Fictibacillus fluitans TaxID=3058422 RepID=A0ABT8HSD3_9BACL|nr:hypothetical protein [Fictibacillus sp. NE201]MDN4523679.1 hypothetical protein [Fictibacillus sp. NE201]
MFNNQNPYYNQQQQGYQQQTGYQQGYQQQQAFPNPQMMKKMQKLCRKNIQHYVSVTLLDGSMYDGFIEFMDGQNIYFASPVVDEGQNSERDNSDTELDYPYYGFVQPVKTYEIERFIIPLSNLANVMPVAYY